MRYIISIFILLLVCPNSLLSQANKSSNVFGNLYSHALYAGLKTMDKKWGHFKGYHDTTRIQIDYHNIVVEVDPDITDNIPSQLDKTKIEFLDHQALIARSKNLQKDFPVIKIHPIQNNKSILYITLNLYWVSFHNDLLNYALSDWCKVVFSFDCNKHKFIITKTELGAI